MVAFKNRSAPGNPSDAELVGRILEGERDLFEVLMRRYNQRVYRTVRGILRQEPEVEDTMQQAYLLAYAHLGEYAGASSFSTWLTRIAMNEAFTSVRKLRRMTPVDEIPDFAEDAIRPATATPEHQAVAQESMRLIESAVDKLPRSYRTAFMLRDVEQLSTDEASETLGITKEAVRVRLHRARRALRGALAAAVGQPAPGDPATPEAFAFLGPRCDRMVVSVMATIQRVEFVESGRNQAHG
ncbi:MAG TPA: RNA polymerase sigma factor [Myxococcales bacterium]|nr:RNA polymerase sigma factor [Myxococcales bacterium]